MSPRLGLTPRLTDWLTVSRNVTLTLTLTWVAVRELLWFIHCDLLLLEAGSWGLGQFGNLEQRERPPLKPLPSNGSEDMTVDTSGWSIQNPSIFTLSRDNIMLIAVTVSLWNSNHSTCLERLRKILVRIPGVRAEVWTRGLLSTK
jgi:hypothetical protein